MVVAERSRKCGCCPVAECASTTSTTFSGVVRRLPRRIAQECAQPRDVVRIEVLQLPQCASRVTSASSARGHTCSMLWRYSFAARLVRMVACCGGRNQCGDAVVEAPDEQGLS